MHCWNRSKMRLVRLIQTKQHTFNESSISCNWSKWWPDLSAVSATEAFCFISAIAERSIHRPSTWLNLKDSEFSVFLSFVKYKSVRLHERCANSRTGGTHRQPSDHFHFTRNGVRVNDMCESFAAVGQLFDERKRLHWMVLAVIAMVDEGRMKRRTGTITLCWIDRSWFSACIWCLSYWSRSTKDSPFSLCTPPFPIHRGSRVNWPLKISLRLWFEIRRRRKSIVSSNIERYLARTTISSNSTSMKTVANTSVKKEFTSVAIQVLCRPICTRKWFIR